VDTTHDLQLVPPYRTLDQVEYGFEVIVGYAHGTMKHEPVEHQLEKCGKRVDRNVGAKCAAIDAALKPFSRGATDGL
jgi:hypothetical protein